MCLPRAACQGTCCPRAPFQPILHPLGRPSPACQPHALSAPALLSPRPVLRRPQAFGVLTDTENLHAVLELLDPEMRAAVGIEPGSRRWQHAVLFSFCTRTGSAHRSRPLPARLHPICTSPPRPRAPRPAPVATLPLPLQVESRLGRTRLFSPENPTGRYTLMLSQLAHACVAKQLLTQYIQQYDAKLTSAPLHVCFTTCNMDGVATDVSDPRKL